MDFMSQQTTKRFCATIGAVGILNFALFAIIAICLGGDALNGRCENGRYFVSNHGKRTEVSEAVFTYSRIHASSVLVTHPLALASGWILSYMDQKNRKASKSRLGLPFAGSSSGRR
jgi:hypothetical protein